MIYRWLILLGLFVCLQACGFQLRGFTSLPDHIANLQLLADDLTVTQRQNLIRQLQQAGVTLNDDENSEDPRLLVSIESLSERKLVDSAGSGKSIVRLSRQLSYSLIDPSGKRLVDNKTLVSNHDFELDENNLLGSEREKQSTLENLDNALINSLMVQLGHL